MFKCYFAAIIYICNYSLQIVYRVFDRIVTSAAGFSVCCFDKQVY